jgi:hypothetical protein
MPRPLLVALAVGFLLTVSPRAHGAEPDPVRAELEALVRQLGADSYEAREEASRQLSAHGLSALAVLKVGQEDHDVEIRTRCRRILATVLVLDFENRMKAFIADSEGKQEHKLPSWNRFRKLVGEDKVSRELFVEMLRSESNLLEAAEESPKSAGEMFAIACRELQQMVYSGQGQQPMSLGSAATLIFVGSDAQIPITEHAAMMVYQFVHQPALQQSLSGGPRVEQVRKLLGAWVGRRVGANTAYQNMMLAMQFNLKEGLAPALDMVKSTGTHASQKAYAIVAVGKLGSKDHLPEIEKLLGDASVCAAYQVNETRISTETRDVALAVLVHLTGQNLKDYGFDRVQSNPQMLFYPYTLGFPDTPKRDAAMKKWRDWQTAQQTAQKKS